MCITLFGIEHFKKSVILVYSFQKKKKRVLHVMRI